MNTALKSFFTFSISLLMCNTGIKADDFSSFRPNYYTFDKDGFTYGEVQQEVCPLTLEVEYNPKYVELDEIIIPELIELGYEDGYNNRDAIVTRIGDQAFSNGLMLKEIKKVSLPSTLISIGTNAFHGIRINTITIPKGVRYLGVEAFSGSEITEMTLPESIEVIDAKCFYDCAYLTKISLPSTLRRLGGLVFAYCGELKLIYSYATVPPEASESDFGRYCSKAALWDCESINLYECILYVPKESIEAYRHAPGWELFENIRAIESTTDVKDLEANHENMNYTDVNGFLRVNCKNCDRMQIFDDKGILLAAAEFNHEETYQ